MTWAATRRGQWKPITTQRSTTWHKSFSLPSLQLACAWVTPSLWKSNTVRKKAKKIGRPELDGSVTNNLHIRPADNGLKGEMKGSRGDGREKIMRGELQDEHQIHSLLPLFTTNWSITLKIHQLKRKRRTRGGGFGSGPRCVTKKSDLLQCSFPVSNL